MPGYVRTTLDTEVFISPHEDHRKIEQEMEDVLGWGGNLTIYHYGRIPYMNEESEAA